MILISTYNFFFSNFHVIDRNNEHIKLGMSHYNFKEIIDLRYFFVYEWSL